jgi:plasmid stabilization system protein ParE
MAFKIAWTQKARLSTAKVVDYLETNWSVKVADEFIDKVNHHLLLLASGNLKGSPTERRPQIKSVLITKHTGFISERGKNLSNCCCFGILAKTLRKIHTSELAS